MATRFAQLSRRRLNGGGAGGRIATPEHGITLAAGLALAAVAFIARGGSELSTTTPVEIALILSAGAVVGAAIVCTAVVRLSGAASLFAFGALAGLTALSIIWSIAPHLSWIEANRTLTYFAVFAAAVALAQLAPRRSAVALRALLIAVGVILGYAAASRVWPGSLAENEIYARLGQPYGYWNAVGATAAIALVPTLWLGTRRSAHPVVSALAYPLVGLEAVALVLSYSRGSLAAAAIGVAIWLVVVPLRLRSLAVLAVPALGVAPVLAWALSKDAFTKDLVPLSAREDVATKFGLLLLATCTLVFGAGLLVGRLAARRPISELLRRRIGIAAVAAVCAVPLVLVATVAVSDRGLAGTISDRFNELTSEDATTPGGPARLTKASSSRGRYWRQAAEVFSDRPALGVGAGAFGLARLRYRKDQLLARHAHGYFAQTLADLGLAGLAVSLALMAAWLVAAARATGVYPGVKRRRRRRDEEDVRWDGERIGTVALALAAIVFWVHSALDWTWFIPGPAVIAIAAAGLVAGSRRAGDRPAKAVAAGADGGQRGARRDPARLVLAALVVVTAFVCAWAVWQPERAELASDSALEAADRGALATAAREADRAHEIDPLSPRPLLIRAAIANAADQPDLALKTLERAVLENPHIPGVWVRLANFQLRELNRPQDALATLQGALYLDPRSTDAQSAFFRARAALREQTARRLSTK